MRDIFGNELPKEGTILLVDQFAPTPSKKEGENNWFPKYKGKKLKHNNKDIVIGGAVCTVLPFANAIEYKRVHHPEMFCGDAVEPNDDDINGYAWIPTCVRS